MDRFGEGERQVRLGQDRLAIKKTSRKKWKQAETMYVVLPTPRGGYKWPAYNWC